MAGIDVDIFHPPDVDYLLPWYASTCTCTWQTQNHADSAGLYGNNIGLNAQTAMQVPDEQVPRLELGSKLAFMNWIWYLCYIWCLKGVLLCLYNKLTSVPPPQPLPWCCNSFQPPQLANYCTEKERTANTSSGPHPASASRPGWPACSRTSASAPRSRATGESSPTPATTARSAGRTTS